MSVTRRLNVLGVDATRACGSHPVYHKDTCHAIILSVDVIGGLRNHPQYECYSGLLLSSSMWMLMPFSIIFSVNVIVATRNHPQCDVNAFLNHLQCGCY